MKTATVKELKTELSHRKPQELLDLCLRLAKFKKENKELLTYLLFEEENEALYIENVKKEIVESFVDINRTSVYFIKKSIRKILRACTKYIRYSKKKETEVDIRLFFCHELLRMTPSLKRSTVLKNIYFQQVKMVEKAFVKLHEDLQYDYQIEVEELQTAYKNR
jgi:hypothetical protein